MFLFAPMFIKLRIIIVILFCLFKLFSVQLLLGETVTKKSDKSLGENVVAHEGLQREGDLEIEEMVDRLKNERKELEKLKVLYEKVSQKGKETKTAQDKDAKAAEEETESTDDQNEPIDQISSQGGQRETDRVNVKGDQERGDIGNERDKITIKDKDKIVQPFEIAENLYKLEEYQLSLDIYKLIKGDEEKENRSWIKYQIANCYRNLKQYDKALEIYNEVEKEFEGSYWAKQSTWYIRDIEWRKGLKENLEEVAGK